MSGLNAKTFYNQPWAMQPDKLRELDSFLRAHGAMGPAGSLAPSFSGEEIAAARARQKLTARAAATPRAIAVIPVIGPIMHRGDPLMELFGFTSAEGIARQLRAALASPEVSAIVLDVDSPGGEVFGTPELADEIYAARSQKRIIAVANSWAASGAYFLASQASELVVIRSGQVGSVGVYMLHVDFSRALDAAGITCQGCAEVIRDKARAAARERPTPGPRQVLSRVLPWRDSVRLSFFFSFQQHVRKLWKWRQRVRCLRCA